MRDGTHERLAEAVLVAHQRKDGGGGCICGWDVLGASWAKHVAAVLNAAGALK